jgi:hypothetical protein
MTDEEVRMLVRDFEAGAIDHEDFGWRIMVDGVTHRQLFRAYASLNGLGVKDFVVALLVLVVLFLLIIVARQ